MSAKNPRTFLALLCVLIILSPSRGKAYRQVFSAIAPDVATAAETSGPDAANRQPFEPADAGQQESGLPQNRDFEAEPPPEEENGGEDISGYENLKDAYGLELNERVVKTFAELKSALSENNGITTVHLGGDITMQGGININSNKSHITIDGIDPGNPEQTEPYTLTDRDSALFTDTIYVSSSAVSYIHVRDLKITGKNYYGPFSVLDSASTSNVKLIFERVDYNGPQLVHHRQGTAYITDCKVRLHGGNGICLSQEFSEAKELVFEGVNAIETASTSNTVFWHPLGGSFTIADDSSVTLTSPGTSGAYGILYADGSAYNVDITIGYRSVFNASILNSVAPVGNVTISSLTVREGGGFFLKTTGAANRDVLSVGGNITVEPDAVFKIDSYGGSYPALSLRTGDITVGNDAVFHIISSNTNSSLLNLYGRALTCNDPASVLLYNPGNRNITASTTPGVIYIDAEQINFRDTASQDGLDNPPLYQWKKADGTNFRIEGTLATGANGNFSSISSNYAEGDSPESAPSAVAFNMQSARVLAFGRLELMVNALTPASEEITGITAPNAVVRASFYRQGVNYVMPDTAADKDGVFVIPVDTPLQRPTEVTVMSSHDYLSASYTAVVEDSGALTFTAPAKLQFYTSELSAKPQIVKRLQPNWQLVVSDTRGDGNTWGIYVRLIQPLTPADSSKPTLENALVFVDDTGTAIPISTNGELLIYRHTTAPDSEMVNIGWASGRGILALIPTGAAYADIPYAGIIEWSLVDAP